MIENKSMTESNWGSKIKSRNFCRKRLLDIKQTTTSACNSSITSSGFLDQGYQKSNKRGRVKESKIEGDLRGSNELDLEKSDSDCKGKQVAKPLEIRVTSNTGEREEEEESKSITCVSHGQISVIGRRRVMEDAVTVVPAVVVDEFGSYDFFAVYDGHGGARVATACKDKMHQLVAEEMEKGGTRKGLEYWEKVMRSCFEKMDEEVMSKADGGGGGGGEGGEDAKAELSVKNMGSTAVVVMLGKEEVVVANCGDSRAILCRAGVAVPLSCDHKPDRPDERERVEAAGGRVINWNGSRVLGVLAMSRSIGDQYLKPYVISEPEVTVNDRTEPDEFIVIATDGLWDVVSNEFACEIVRKCFCRQIKIRVPDEFSGTCAAKAAAVLAELAMARGSKDNISVIVVELKSSK